MSNLIKADLFRIIKSKITFVSLILAVGVPLIIVLMYFGVSKATDLFADQTGLVGNLFTAKMLIASAFSLTDNFGIIIPIFVTIFVASDLSSGTLRNKVIIGSNRVSIYLSHFITSIIYNVIIVTIYALFTAIFALLFLEYGEEFNKEALKSLLYIIGLGILAFVFVASISTFFALIVNSTPVAIILTIAFCFVLSFSSTIISFLDYEEYKYLVYALPLFVNGASIKLTTVTNVMFIEGVSSLVLFSAVNTTVGILLFKNKDLK